MSMRSKGLSTLDLISSAGACARILYASHMSSSEGQLLQNDAELSDLNQALGAAYCIAHQFEVDVSIAGKVFMFATIKHD